MSGSKRRHNLRIMKVRFWMMGIILLFALSIFCFAIWDGTQHGFTSNTTIYGLILAFTLFWAGVFGGPALKERLKNRRIKTSPKAQKRYIVEACRRGEQ